MKKQFTNRSRLGARALRLACCTAFIPALMLGSERALGQAGADARDPHPAPPHMQDVKLPAPPLVERTLAAGPRANSTHESQRSPAAQPPAEKLPAGLRYMPAIDHDRLDYDQRDDALWVHGANWKASFTRDGATFIPFFGSKAPRDFPVSFRVESARRGAAAIALSAPEGVQRAGDRVELDRGALVERYDLSPSQLEQSFVFAHVPEADGDLVVRLRVDTELVAHAAADGVDLANELGRVHYGGAKVVDAAGRERTLESRIDAGAIELSVPADFVRGATLPITIDPVILVFGVDETGYNDYAPDIAFDALSDNYIIVYEEEYSATDHDVYAMLISGSTNVVAQAYIDSSTQDWREPSVADNALNSEYLVAASVTVPLSSGWNIFGRTIHANNLVQGAVFQINESLGYDMFHPVVGGDGTYAAPVYYLVAFQRNYASDDTDILARLVAPGGTNVGSTIYISNSSGTLDYTPHISKSDGNPPSGSQEWTVVWSRVKTPSDWDVYGAQLFWDGTVTAGPYAIDTSTNDDRDVHVSPVLDGTANFIERPHMLTLTRNNGDIVYSVWRGANYITSGYLSDLEQDGYAGELQWSSAVETDGHKFAIAYTESYQGTSDMDTWLTTVELAGTQVVPSEVHQMLGFTSYIESAPAIASRHSGGGGEWDFWVTWQTLVPPSYSGDIDAAVYSAPVFTSICNPGIDATPCPCGNAPLAYHGCENSASTGGAVLAGTGAASTDTVTLTASGMLPHATAVFLQGTTYLGWQGGVSFGDGVRCIGGTLVRLATKAASSGIAIFPGAGDASIKQTSSAHGNPIGAGVQRFYQTYYRDPANFACAGGATFNITNGIVIDW
jgi:hypothetical protein